MSFPPWKQIKSRVVFRNPHLVVRSDVVRQPDGKRGTYAYLDYPGGGGVGVVAADQQQRIYLVYEYKYPVRVFGYHLPSGGIELGEQPLAAAKRELQEELGVTARRWSSLGVFFASDGSSNEKVHLFLAQDLKVGRLVVQPLEPLTMVRMPLKKAVKMVLDGRITCSYAITGITRAAAKLGLLKC